MIKVTWDVEELVALIDLYRREQRGEIPNLDIELEKLSTVLNRRASKLCILHDEKYRNFSGMKMMYQNVEYIATNGQRGMSAVSSSMRKVYSLLSVAPDVFDLILEEFKTRYVTI